MAKIPPLDPQVFEEEVSQADEQLALRERDAYEQRKQFNYRAFDSVASLLETHVTSQKNDSKHREKYAVRIFQLVVIWLGVVLAILFFNSFGYGELSDSVLIALITGSTLNVLSLLATIISYLFTKKSEMQTVLNTVVHNIMKIEEEERTLLPNKS